MNRILGSLTALLVLAAAATGQEAGGMVTATVVQVAGSTVYVDVGSASGLAEGMEVEVAGADTRMAMGWLVVLGVTEDRAGLTFQGAAFPLTRGQRILLLLPEGGPGGGEPADSAATDSARAEVAAPSTGVRPRRPGTGPRLSGSVGLELEGLRSTSSWAEQVDGTVSQQLLRPALRLRATVSGLPAGLSGSTDLRVWNRASDAAPYEPGTSIRVYQASVGRDQGVFRFRAGRFWAQQLPFAAYWDGAMARVGGGLGAGVALGFTPTAGAEGMDTDAPKLAAFVDYDQRGENGPQAWGSVSFMQKRLVWEDTTVRSLGWTQRARWGIATLANRIEWELGGSDGLAHANVDLALDLPAGTRITAGWLRDRFRPFAIDAQPRAEARVRERSSVGVAWNGIPGGIDLRAGVLGGDETGRSLDGTVWVAPLRPGLPTLSFASSYWTADDRTWLFASPSARKRFGRVDVRVAYHHYRIDDGTLLRLNGGDLSLTVPVGAVWFRSGVQGEWGGELTTVRFRTALWLRF